MQSAYYNRQCLVPVDVTDVVEVVDVAAVSAVANAVVAKD